MGTGDRARGPSVARRVGGSRGVRGAWWIVGSLVAAGALAGGCRRASEDALPRSAGPAVYETKGEAARPLLPPAGGPSGAPAGAPMGAMPPGHPPMGAAGAPGMAGMPAAAAPGGAAEVVWTAPPEWRAEPPSSGMRVAQWKLPSESGEPPECAMFRFPGGGNVQDNVRRWFGQFEPPTDGNTDGVGEQAVQEIDGLRVTLVRTRGTFVSQGPTMTGPAQRFPEWALFGAVVESGGTPVFLKCTGPASAMSANAESLSGFVQSFRRGG